MQNLSEIYETCNFSAMELGCIEEAKNVEVQVQAMREGMSMIEKKSNLGAC